MGEYYDSLCSGNDFMIGNSASLTNNHLDVFKILKSIDLQSSKIVVPLSYGDKSYANEIETIGRNEFGDSFMPLIHFMPINEYNTILNRCGNIVMAHTRQQGMGNIIMALWKGARVFLHQENPIYHFLKSNDFAIYTLKDIKNAHDFPKPGVLAQQNRPLLEKIYAKEQVLLETRKLVEVLMSRKRKL